MHTCPSCGQALPEGTSIPANLTPKQMEVAVFIRDRIERVGSAPTIQETADRFGLRKVTALERIEALLKKGVLVRAEAHAVRGLSIAPGVRLPREGGQ